MPIVSTSFRLGRVFGPSFRLLSFLFLKKVHYDSRDQRSVVQLLEWNNFGFLGSPSSKINNLGLFTDFSRYCKSKVKNIADV